MRKWITLLMTLLVGSCVSYADASTGQLNFEAGYRRDNISWKHQFPSSDPVFSSSIRLRDLDIFQIGLKGRTTLGCNLYVRANAYWGWILNGDIKQSFTAYNNQSAGYGYDDSFRFGCTFEDETCNPIDDKYVYGVGAAIGYPFFFCDCSLIIAPVIGYADDEQDVCVEQEGLDFYNNYGYFFPTEGSCCCEHKFHHRWYGPFVGLDFSYRPCNECWSLYAELEYHWGNFIGRRHGNGFDFFDNCRHSSRDAHAWVFSAGADYDLCDCWTVGISVKFQDWRASRHHRECFSDYSCYFGSFCDNRSRDNQRWHSYAINVTIGREF